MSSKRRSSATAKRPKQDNPFAAYERASQQHDDHVKLLGKLCDDDDSYEQVMVIKPDGRTVVVRCNDIVCIYIDDVQCHAQILKIFIDEEDNNLVKAMIMWFFSYKDLIKKEASGDPVLPGGAQELESLNFQRTDYAFSADCDEAVDITYIDSLSSLELQSSPFTFNWNERVLTNINLSFNAKEDDAFAGFLLAKDEYMFHPACSFGENFYLRFLKPYCYFGVSQKNEAMYDWYFQDDTLQPYSDIRAVALPQPERGVCQLCMTTKTLSHVVREFKTDTEFKVGIHCYNRLMYVDRAVELIHTARESIANLDRKANPAAFISNARNTLMKLAHNAERTLK